MKGYTTPALNSERPREIRGLGFSLGFYYSAYTTLLEIMAKLRQMGEKK
jgi:hypothetical protein